MWLLTAAILALTESWAAATFDCSNPPANYELKHGKYYRLNCTNYNSINVDRKLTFRMTEVRKTYIDTKAECESEGAQLAVVEDEYQFEEVFVPLAGNLITVLTSSSGLTMSLPSEQNHTLWITNFESDPPGSICDAAACGSMQFKWLDSAGTKVHIWRPYRIQSMIRSYFKFESAGRLYGIEIKVAPPLCSALAKNNLASLKCEYQPEPAYNYHCYT